MSDDFLDVLATALAHPKLSAEECRDRVMWERRVESWRTCAGCKQSVTVEELRIRLATTGVCPCGYRPPLQPLRSPHRFELGPDGWPMAVR